MALAVTLHISLNVSSVDEVGGNFVVGSTFELIFVPGMTFDDDINFLGIVATHVDYQHFFIPLKNML